MQPSNSLNLTPAVLQGQRAIITLKALAEAFPTRPPATIRLFVKDACDLVVRVSDMHASAAVCTAYVQPV